MSQMACVKEELQWRELKSAPAISNVGSTTRGREAMDLKLNKDIGKYYRLATKAREKASAAANPVSRQELLNLERQWLLSAYRCRISAQRDRKRGSGDNGQRGSFS
jgi:hypothetical protein